MYAFFISDCRRVSLTNRHLRSADTRTCVVPRTNTLFGDITFSNSGPKIGNSPPSALRQPGLRFAMFNNILNPTCLMRFETEALRDSCFYGRHISPCMYNLYVWMYVCIWQTDIANKQAKSGKQSTTNRKTCKYSTILLEQFFRWNVILNQLGPSGISNLDNHVQFQQAWVKL